MPVQKIFDVATSAAANGSWVKTNYNYESDSILTFFVSSVATAAGDLALEAALDENGTTTVCVAPFAAGSGVLNVLDVNYPYIRVKKLVNARGGQVHLVTRNG